MIVIYRGGAYDLSKAVIFGLDKDTERTFAVSFDGDNFIGVVEYQNKQFAWDAWVGLLTAIQRRQQLYELPQEVNNG